MVLVSQLSPSLITREEKNHFSNIGKVMFLAPDVVVVVVVVVVVPKPKSVFRSLS